MNQIFALQICSTGETILQEETQWSMISWQKRKEKRLLKSKKTAKRFKEAILNNDTIVGWVNYEQCPTLCSFVFKGYDKFFEKRILNA